jgi:hypothetical protein
MKMRTKIIVAISGLVIATGAGYVSIAQPPQPHMQNALADLQAAKAELQAAERNKGGHRATAIGLINQAIGEVESGIAVGDGY